MNERATLAVVGDDDAPVVEKLTEGDVLRTLWRHFGDRWAAIAQVTVAPNDLVPFTNVLALATDGEPPNDGTERRIDMLLARRAKNREKAGEYETMAVEVKVTRSDFLSDMRNPAKQEPWKKAATRHIYAVPAGLIQASEVPPECGLLWVYSQPLAENGWSYVRWVKQAPYIPGHRPQPPARVLNTIFHRLSRLEAEQRGYIRTAELVPGSPEELRAKVAEAEQQIKDLKRKLETAQGRVDAWQAAYAIAAADGLPCGTCGQPIRPLRPTKHWFSSWRHVDKEHDEPCDALAAEKEIERAKAAYDESDTDHREWMLRNAHRRGFRPEIEAEPWRAWVNPGLRHQPEPAINVPDEYRAGDPQQMLSRRT